MLPCRAHTSMSLTRVPACVRKNTTTSRSKDNKRAPSRNQQAQHPLQCCDEIETTSATSSVAARTTPPITHTIPTGKPRDAFSATQGPHQAQLPQKAALPQVSKVEISPLHLQLLHPHIHLFLSPPSDCSCTYA